MFLKLNNSPKHNSLRSRPPAGQHQQKEKSSFSKINKVNVNKVNVKVNVNKVNVKVNDIYSIHSHYKGGGRWPPPQKRCRGLTAAAPLLWFPL